MKKRSKRATGGPAGHMPGEGPHAPHMMLIIGLAPKKPKKKAGGKVEGKAAKHHLGRRARGGPACRADGGPTDASAQQKQDQGGGFLSSLRAMGDGLRPLKNVPQEMQKAGEDAKRASGGHIHTPGRMLDAREDAHTDGRDKTSEGSGTGERAQEVAIGEARARGGRSDHWIQNAREGMEKHGTKGALHRAMNVPAGEKIPEQKLERAKAKAERSGDTKMVRRITFAENVRR